MSVKQMPVNEQKNFINFSTAYDSSISILIIISVLAIIIYLLNKLRSRKYEYHSQEYWESRYSLFPKYMDWYCSLDKLKSDFKIDELLNTYYSRKNKTKVLELGCGNSSLAFDLHNNGYKKITSIDFSQVVINHMKEKYGSSTNIKFVCGDFTRMNEIFNENEFDLIVEKAGLDSIATKGTPDAPLILKTVYNQIYKVLKPGGFVLSFSIKNPQFWHEAVFDLLIKSKMFRLDQQECTVFTTEKNPTLMNLYFYKLVSLKA